MATSDDAARERLHGRITAAADHAALHGIHPGDWRLHHTWRCAAPGDFTPVTVPDYQEEEITLLDQLLELLGGEVRERAPLEFIREPSGMEAGG